MLVLSSRFRLVGRKDTSPSCVHAGGVRMSDRYVDGRSLVLFDGDRSIVGRSTSHPVVDATHVLLFSSRTDSLCGAESRRRGDEAVSRLRLLQLERGRGKEEVSIRRSMVAAAVINSPVDCGGAVFRPPADARLNGLRDGYIRNQRRIRLRGAQSRTRSHPADWMVTVNGRNFSGRCFHG